MSNRRAVTMRFTAEEYDVLQELAVRYKQDEKKVLKFAFALLAQSTGKLEERMKEDKSWEAGLANRLTTDSEPSTSED